MDRGWHGALARCEACRLGRGARQCKFKFEVGLQFPPHPQEAVDQLAEARRKLQQADLDVQ